ncbi:phenylacetic acid degradation protein [Comamonas serinivorans]|uniref:Phenylacetic acid degradation protein n=1 Tax=Comamonas serinivorans TaxID=1082851 RepID=A0A1Y0EP44_9BURK|nr:PaaI family thioesterase [Comamonas serinivorans]ARU05171.1 phenylacetic acid degradation protein [Comamonas serinivorans]
MSLNFGASIPFVNLLGFTLEKFDGGESEMHFEVLPQYMNTYQVAHGGAVMTLMDVSMATAARSLRLDSGVVTIEMKTSFMRPGLPGATGKLVAKGRVVHHTKSMAFVESHIYNGDGDLCAQGSGTFRYVNRNDGVVFNGAGKPVDPPTD